MYQSLPLAHPRNRNALLGKVPDCVDLRVEIAENILLVLLVLFGYFLQNCEKCRFGSRGTFPTFLAKTLLQYCVPTRPAPLSLPASELKGWARLRPVLRALEWYLIRANATVVT